MVRGNTSVVVQNMFSITPKLLDTINVVLGSLIDKFLGVIDHQMFTKALQRLIASKGIRKVNRALTDMVLDMGHEGLRQYQLHYLSIDPASNRCCLKAQSFSNGVRGLLCMALKKIGIRQG